MEWRHLKADEVRGPTMPISSFGKTDHRSMKTVSRRPRILIL
jgi:hypothetical protein